jgi:UrcA family protein
MSIERRPKPKMKEQAMRKSVVTVLAAPAVLWAAAIATPAAAEEATVLVNYGDLDLTDPAGVAVLETRIAAAVKEVCNKTEPRLLRGLAAWEECKAKSLADAMEQVAAVAP